MEFLRSKQVTVLVVVLIVLFGALALKALKEFAYVGAGVPAEATITVAGEGLVFAVPDVVEFSFSVDAEESTMAAAQEAAAEGMNAVIAYLESEGVAEKDIRTTGYNAYPRYEWRNGVTEIGGGIEYLVSDGSTRVLVGYVVTQSVSVTVRDTENAGSVLAGVTTAGATNVSGLNFTVDKPEALEMEAREMAINDARAQAEVLADQLGVSIVRVVSFSENGYYQPFYNRVAYDVAEDSGGGSAPKIALGENEIRSNVSVTYEIR